jgi:hypothetical protein
MKRPGAAFGMLNIRSSRGKPIRDGDLNSGARIRQFSALKGPTRIAQGAAGAALGMPERTKMFRTLKGFQRQGAAPSGRKRGGGMTGRYPGLRRLRPGLSSWTPSGSNADRTAGRSATESGGESKDTVANRRRVAPQSRHRRRTESRRDAQMSLGVESPRGSS